MQKATATLMVAATLIAGPDLGAQQQPQTAGFLAGLEAGETAADTMPTSSGWLLGAVVGAGTGYLTEWDSQGAVFGSAAVIGLTGSLFGYYAGTSHMEPSEEWEALNESESREYREGFRRGYRERMRDRQLKDAALFGIATTLTYAIVASTQMAEEEQEDSGIVVTLRIGVPW